MPRGLIAAALLVWGWETGHLLMAVPMALLVEAPAWVRTRWPVSDAEFNRIADVSSVLFVVLVVYQFATRAVHGIYGVLGMVPVVLFPLLVSQRFSERGRLPLAALFVSLRRLDAAPPHPGAREVDLSGAFVVACLLAAAAGNRQPLVYFVLCALTLAWLLAGARPSRHGRGRWAAALLLATGLGYGVQLGMQTAQIAAAGLLLELADQLGWRARDPDHARTAIGELGRLKLSDRIRVRVHTPQPLTGPLYLAEASYDHYDLGSWRTARREFIVVDALPGTFRWRLAPPPPAPLREATVSIRSADEVGVMPLPEGTVELQGNTVLELSRNAYGAVRLEMPVGYREVTAYYAPGAAPQPPPRPEDLDVPERYREVFGRLADELGLAALPPAGRVRRVEQHFARHFSYTLVQHRFAGRMPLVSFLTDRRAGHCEYFATATALLLRAAGIPARYTVGYVADEYSALEGAYVARARDAHAWVTAWIDGRWQRVDTTPSVWAELEQARHSWLQPLLDLWSWGSYRLAALQRDETVVQRYGGWALLPLALLLAWRLGRRRRSRAGGAGPAATLLRALAGADSELSAVIEALARRGLGPAPDEPLGAWCRRVARRPELAGMAAMLEEAVRLHYRHRFDPRGITRGERRRLRALGRRLLAALERPPGAAQLAGTGSGGT